eukprot:3889867-Prymnesium_polylepis.1
MWWRRGRCDRWRDGRCTDGQSGRSGRVQHGYHGSVEHAMGLCVSGVRQRNRRSQKGKHVQKGAPKKGERYLRTAQRCNSSDGFFAARSAALASSPTLLPSSLQTSRQCVCFPSVRASASA